MTIDVARVLLLRASSSSFRTSKDPITLTALPSKRLVEICEPKVDIPPLRSWGRSSSRASMCRLDVGDRLQHPPASCSWWSFIAEHPSAVRAGAGTWSPLPDHV